MTNTLIIDNVNDFENECIRGIYEIYGVMKGI